MFANALARRTNRPAQLFHHPGMLLLVPGSFGFLSFDRLLRGQLAAGAETALQIIVASALVMGVLAANVILPARKLL